MRTAVILAAATLAALFTAPALAQLPTATGKQIAMSNAAWKIFIPSGYQQRPGEVADLLVHFHGDPQTFYNNARYANLNAVIVTVNYSGLSSAYSTPFSNASLFQTLVSEALTKVRLEANIPDALQWDSLAVSSFSAGYGAVREILKSATYRNDIDGLLAADSLYATTAGDGTPLDSQMTGHKTFAALAQGGSKTMIYSHSLVPTYTYESTQECGDELLQHLGLAATANNFNGLGTLNFYRQASQGKFKLLGATGADGDSHLEHLRYIGEFLKELPLAHVPTMSADFSKDGPVSGLDLAVWQNAFGEQAAADADGDGDSDGGDFLAWQRQMGSPAAPPGSTAAAVPEPASAALVACGLATIAVAGWRRGLRRGRLA